MLLDFLNKDKALTISSKANGLFAENPTHVEYKPAPIILRSQIKELVSEKPRKKTMKEIPDVLKRDLIDDNTVVDKTRLSDRTIVFSNLFVEADRKVFMKFLKFEKSHVFSLRYRNISFKMPNISPGRGINEKLFNERRDTMTCYVTFCSVEHMQSAYESLEARDRNDLVFEGKHIMYLKATEVEYDAFRALFLGNLPLDVTEQDIYDFFVKAGQVENVRVVRDPATGLCRGVGYVLFKSASSVPLALTMKGRNFCFKFGNPHGDRTWNLRISRIENKSGSHAAAAAANRCQDHSLRRPSKKKVTGDDLFASKKMATKKQAEIKKNKYEERAKRSDKKTETGKKKRYRDMTADQISAHKAVREKKKFKYPSRDRGDRGDRK